MQKEGVLFNRIFPNNFRSPLFSTAMYRVLRGHRVPCGLMVKSVKLAPEGKGLIPTPQLYISLSPWDINGVVCIQCSMQGQLKDPTHVNRK